MSYTQVVNLFRSGGSTLKSIFEKVLSIIVGHENDLNSEESRRDLLIIIIGLLAVFVLIGVATASLMSGELKTALLDYSASIVLILLLMTYHWTSYQRLCRYLGVAFMYGLYLYLFIIKAGDGTTYMWHYTFPFFAIFLIGARHGAIATILLFIPVFTLVIQDALSPHTGLYSSSFAIRFIPSVTVALIFAFLFEKERTRFKSQVLKAHHNQEKIIAERSEQLLQEIADREFIARKLRQSQKMEAIGTMASGVAHDLNNILSGVVTYPQLIRMDLPPESPLTKPLMEIEQAGKRAAAVVYDLLTLARDAASVKKLTDINTLIEAFLISPEWLAIIKPYPELKIVSELKARESIAYCSEVHLRKCIMNLLINAVEATPATGTVTITSSNQHDTSLARSVGNEGSNIFLSIIDQGPGVAAEHLEKIFEPFYTTKEMGRSGSGLGLSVVWNTIEEHDGEIFIENRTVGAEFCIRFPVLKGEYLETVFPEISLDELQGQGQVLIVDDEPQLSELAYNIIQKLGYSGVVVESGEDAIQQIQKGRFDLILLDMVLGGGLTGYQTFKEIININPEQKAIIVSGYSTSEDVRKTLSLGACTIIRKPYSIEEIGKAIKDCINPVLPPQSDCSGDEHGVTAQSLPPGRDSL